MSGPQLTGRDGQAAGPGDGGVAGRPVRVEQLLAGPGPAPPAGRRQATRAAALAVGALALVALVAALSGGLPGRVHGSGGSGLSAPSLLGDAAAALLVFVLAGVAFMAYSEWANRERRRARRSRRRRRRRALRRPSLDPQLLAIPLALAVIGALLLALVSLLGGTARREAIGAPSFASGFSSPHAVHTVGSGGRASIDPVVLIVVAALLGIAVAVYVVRSRRQRAGAGDVPAQDALVAAVDDSLEDLANEQDPRRAVIKAYDRMERALAANGAARDRAETPVEYLRRALGAVQASQASIRRLTDLFEQARFSRHTIDGEMKLEAIGALTALRAELAGAGAIGGAG